MAGLVVLDAGVLIALLDSTDAHHDWALGLFNETLSDEWTMSALTYAEVMVYPQQAGRLREFKKSVAGLNLDIRGMDGEDAETLASLRAQTGLKMPDAVVVNLAATSAANLATTDKTVAQQAMKHGLHVLSPSRRP